MICLVGNKCDQPYQIEQSEINTVVESIGLPSYFVSAKSGEGVQMMFTEICEKLIKTSKMKK
jgi:hypothetical protein